MVGFWGSVVRCLDASMFFSAGEKHTVQNASFLSPSELKDEGFLPLFTGVDLSR